MRVALFSLWNRGLQQEKKMKISIVALIFFLGLVFGAVSRADALKSVVQLGMGGGGLSYDPDMTVTYLSDGTLNVTVKTSGAVKSKQLSRANASRLASLAQQLANAKIVDEKRDLVCFMVPLNAEVLLLPDASGEFQKILSSSGCWHKDYIHPVDTNDLETAKAIETMMSTLAWEMVQN